MPSAATNSGNVKEEMPRRDGPGHHFNSNEITFTSRSAVQGTACAHLAAVSLHSQSNEYIVIIDRFPNRAGRSGPLDNAAPTAMVDPVSGIHTEGKKQTSWK
jgi:hypothetical protein